MELRKLTLEGLGGGVIPELFQRELSHVLENIDDGNTEAKAARKITVELTFRPDANREAVALGVKAKSTLAQVKG